MTSQMDSKPFWGGGVTASNAVMTVAGSVSASQLFLGAGTSYDSVYNYEEVSNGVSHTFLFPGLWLKWRVLGNNGYLDSIIVVINQ